MPSSRTDFWRGKFAANVARDKRNLRALRASGWHAIVIWQCEIDACLTGAALTVQATLASQTRYGHERLCAGFRGRVQALPNPAQ
jgi:DNA mismatch endonuclease (patch repair protein)